MSRGTAAVLALLVSVELASTVVAQNSGTQWTNWLAGYTYPITAEPAGMFDTECGNEWGLRTPYTNSPGYYSFTTSTNFAEAYGTLKHRFKAYKPFLQVQGLFNNVKRWDYLGYESTTPAALQPGPIWKSWDDAGVSRSHQDKIAFQVLSLPPKENIEYLVIVCGGTQQKFSGWVGNAAAMTGSVANYHENFSTTTATNIVSLYKESFAYQVYKTTTQGLPMSKTLFVNILDNAYPGMDLSFDEKQDNMLGWKNFLDQLVATDPAALKRWYKIKGVVVAGMSRGGCWVLQFLGNYIKHLVPNTAKFIIETDDPVCDPRPGAVNVNQVVNPELNTYEFIDSVSLPSQVNSLSYNHVGNAKVWTALEAVNPLQHAPATNSPNSHKCKKAQVDSYLCAANAPANSPCTPRENICWLNIMGGQKVVNKDHYALCAEQTTSVWNSVPAGHYIESPSAAIAAGTTGPNKQTYFKTTATGFPWYHQHWVPWSHCIIGRSAYQTKTPNSHLHHFKQCVASMGLVSSTPPVLGYKRCQGWSAPQCATVGNQCKYVVRCTGYDASVYSAASLPGTTGGYTLAQYTAAGAGPFFPDCTTSSCYGYLAPPNHAQALPAYVNGVQIAWDIQGLATESGQVVVPGFGMELNLFSITNASCNCALPSQLPTNSNGYIYTPNVYPEISPDPNTYIPNPNEPGGYINDVHPLPPLSSNTV